MLKPSHFLVVALTIRYRDTHVNAVCGLQHGDITWIKPNDSEKNPQSEFC